MLPFELLGACGTDFQTCCLMLKHFFPNIEPFTTPGSWALNWLATNGVNLIHMALQITRTTKI